MLISRRERGETYQAKWAWPSFLSSCKPWGHALGLHDENETIVNIHRGNSSTAELSTEDKENIEPEAMRLLRDCMSPQRRGPHGNWMFLSLIHI